MNARTFAKAAGMAVLIACANARAGNADALIQKGDDYDSHLQTQKALDAYLAAENLEPRNADLLRRIAKEYGELMPDTDSADQKRNLGEKALEYAKQAVACDSHNAMAQLAIAVCYGRVAPLLDSRTKIDYSRLVKEHADTSLALDPNNDLTYNVLGAWNYELAGLNPILRGIASMIYGDVPKASYEDAETNYEKALRLNPNRLGNHVGLGRTYAALGKTEQAKEELNRALSMPDREKDDPFEKKQAREALGKL